MLWALCVVNARLVPVRDRRTRLVSVGGCPWLLTGPRGDYVR